MRPLALMRETEALEIGDVSAGTLLCRSQRVLGNGRLEGIRDLVVVDFQRFERAKSREAAQRSGASTPLLVASRTPYVLVGVGRWGSRDPWLGIPVTWDQVAGAQVIVEAGLRDLDRHALAGHPLLPEPDLLQRRATSPSTPRPETESWTGPGWTRSPRRRAASHVRHIRLEQPVLVLMNGKRNEGVILKPPA